MILFPKEKIGVIFFIRKKTIKNTVFFRHPSLSWQSNQITNVKLQFISTVMSSPTGNMPLARSSSLWYYRTWPKKKIVGNFLCWCFPLDGVFLAVVVIGVYVTASVHAVNLKFQLHSSVNVSNSKCLLCCAEPSFWVKENKWGQLVLQFDCS